MQVSSKHPISFLRVSERYLFFLGYQKPDIWTLIGHLYIECPVTMVETRADRLD